MHGNEIFKILIQDLKLLFFQENKYEQFLIRKFKRILQENRMLVACQILGFTRLQLRHIR